MRPGRLIACMSLAIAAAVFACSTFDAGPAPPVPIVDAAAKDDVVTPPPTEDATLPLDGSVPKAEAGAFLWEAHFTTGSDNLRDPVGLAPNPRGGAHFGTSVLQPVTFGGTTLPVGSAIIGTDGANAISTTTSLVPRFVQDLAVDSLGDVYVAGQYTGSAPFSFPLEGDAGAPFPGVVGGAATGYVGKIHGTTGKTMWAWPFRHEEDAGAFSSAASSIATRAQEVAVGFTFTGAAVFPFPGGDIGTVASTSPISGAPAVADAFLVTLNPANGGVLWGRRLGSATTQALFRVGFEGRNVFAGGYTQGPVPINGNASAGLSSSVPPAHSTAMLLTLNGESTNHELLGGRVIEVQGDGDFASVVYDIKAIGEDIFVCGRYRQVKMFDGRAVPSRGFNDGFVARYKKRGNELDWLVTFGGSLEDECTSLALDSAGDVLIAVNHASSSVEIGGTKLSDPPVAGQHKSAIVRLHADGTAASVRDVFAAGPTHIARLVVGTNGDVFYAGHLQGAVDLGGGPLDTPPNEITFFVVRRRP